MKLLSKLVIAALFGLVMTAGCCDKCHSKCDKCSQGTTTTTTEMKSSS